jgi:hypothetical protein
MIGNVNDSSKKRTGKMKQLRTIVAVFVFAIFSKIIEVVLDFSTLQDKHDIRTLLLKIKLICTYC